MHTNEPTNRRHGVMAEFESAQAVVDAARKVMAHGFTKVEGYSPVPIEELNDIIHQTRTVLPKLVLAGGLTGMAIGFALQYWASVIEYPMNIGGRPLHTWPSFIPVAFETTILGAALAAVLGMLALNGLPEPYHPIFNAPRFRMASRNTFFLCIESKDAQFNREATEAFLKSLQPQEVTEVDW